MVNRRVDGSQEQADHAHQSNSFTSSPFLLNRTTQSEVIHHPAFAGYLHHSRFYLGFRSQSLAPPQALRFRSRQRASNQPN